MRYFKRALTQYKLAITLTLIPSETPYHIREEKQLYAVLAGSTISNFIRPQWISSGVENIGIAGNSGNTQRQCKIQEGRPNLKLGGFGLTY